MSDNFNIRSFVGLFLWFFLFVFHQVVSSYLPYYFFIALKILGKKPRNLGLWMISFVEDLVLPWAGS